MADPEGPSPPTAFRTASGFTNLVRRHAMASATRISAVSVPESLSFRQLDLAHRQQ